MANWATNSISLRKIARISGESPRVAHASRVSVSASRRNNVEMTDSARSAKQGRFF